MKVRFPSHGQTLVGELYLPDAKPFGAAVLIGPLTSVKEQVTGNYATALTERGWAALSFDPRYFGESSGEPRQYENPRAKIDDVRAAVDFLEAHSGLGTERMVGIGVCAGGGYMAGAVAEEPRFVAFGAVAGFFHDAAKQREWSGAGYETILEKARLARERWTRSGVVDTIPAVGKTGEVAMPLAEAYEYYGTERGGQLGQYVNAFAVMSREHTLPYDAQAMADKISVPTTVVHSDKALAPALARSFFERLTVTKHLEWLESQGQIDFYDDPRLIAQACDALDRTFRERLC